MDTDTTNLSNELILRIFLLIVLIINIIVTRIRIEPSLARLR